MIATATTGTGFKGVISYIQKEHEKDLSKEDSPELLAKNNIYGDTKKMSSQMRFLANENTRVSRPVLHVAISFHKEEKLTAEKTEKAINSVLKEIGVEKNNNQYLLVKHNDAKHEHYHIVVNKVGLDGKNINTSYIKNRLQVACDKVEKEQGLRRTEGRTILYDPTNEKGYRFLTKEEKLAVTEKKRTQLIRDKSPKIRDEKNHVKSKVSEALKDNNNTSPDKLKVALEKENIQTRFMENKNGICGISFRYGNQSYKGTELNNKWKEVSNKLNQNNRDKQALIKKENSMYSKNKEDWVEINKRNPSTFPLDLKKFSNEEQKEIMFTKDYNKAINNVIDKHKEEYNKQNIKPDSDRIFKENGFKKDQDIYVFEKEGHKQELRVKAFEVANKQVKDELENYKIRLEKYNDLMNTKLKKEPLFLGKDKVIEQNLKLKREQREAVKPKFEIGKNVLNNKSFEIQSKSVEEKKKQIYTEKFKSNVEKGREEKGKEGEKGIIKEEENNKKRGFGI